MHTNLYKGLTGWFNNFFLNTLLIHQCSTTIVTVKGKMDTNGYPFQEVNHSLSVPYLFERLKKSVQSVRQAVRIRYQNRLVQNADCRLPTGYKMQTEPKMQTDKRNCFFASETR